mmetsp:Transcript_41353/g.47083  ORF Transcript_41353/g.47083 Transcript_41353/m.47083 type:complete len:106 (+) Transcript_41353:31-348(+)
MTSSTPIQQYRRRSSCSTMVLVAAAAAMTSSTSTCTQRTYHGSIIIIPRQSSTLLPASIGNMDKSRDSPIFGRELIDNDSSLEKHLNANSKRSCQEEQKNMDDTE